MSYCSNSPFLLKSASLLSAKGTFFGAGWGETGCPGSIVGSVGLVIDGGASVGWAWLLLVCPVGGVSVYLGGGGLRGLIGVVEGEGLLRCCVSSRSCRHGGTACTGTYLRRNLRFLNVSLPDPSTRTKYWSNCLTSTMTPVLSHLVGCDPV